jgi:subtilisin family serine protease
VLWGAWDTTRGDEDIVVAVIDTGTDRDHPDLASNMWTNPREICDNGIDDDGNGYVDDCHGWDFYHRDNTVFDPYDGDEHGTHVSGTIAAVADNGIGVAGVAPNITVMPIKFLGPGGGYLEDAILSVEYAAANGAHLSNNSWGCWGCFSQALEDAIEAAEMPFVAAAGNWGDDNDVDPFYPASYDLPNVLSVAAVDNAGDLAWFSNYGATSVDVGAPGVDVLSTLPAGGVAGAALQNNDPFHGGENAKPRMYWAFGLEDIVGAADRRDALDLTLQGIGPAKSSSILLVDEDGSPSGYPNFRPPTPAR